MATDEPDFGNSRRKTRRHSASTYVVGYGKPPAATQFKSGQSGNPSGRPKGRRNRLRVPGIERLKAIVGEEAYRKIRINDGSKQLSVPIVQAAVRAILVSAAKGDHRAQRLAFEMLSTCERELRQDHDKVLKAAIDYKVDWDEECARRKRLGIVGPEPVPHPDDIEVDFENGEVRICGPLTMQQKTARDRLISEFDHLKQEILGLMAQLNDPANKSIRRQLRQDIQERCVRVNEILDIVGRI